MTITINNRPIDGGDTPPSTRLSDFLRQNGCQSVKVGCNAGDCGACAVHIDGQLACSCMVPIAQCHGARVDTLEGLNNDPIMQKIQASFKIYGASQCGICTPAMVMAGYALCKNNPTPTHQQVKDALGGILCRCTGYEKIIAALVNHQKPIPNPHQHALVHVDADQKICGLSQYGADAVPNNALEVKIIRSPHHHAQFAFGDIAQWQGKHPNIKGVYSAKDILGANKFGVIPPFADQPVFAVDTTIFKGEAVAMVVGIAGTLTPALLRGFPIEWRELPAVLTPAPAKLADNIHPKRDGNILVRGFVGKGDVEQGRASAQFHVSDNFSTPFIEHAYIEPEAGWAEWQGDILVVHGCTQAPQMDKDSLMEIMNMPADKIVVAPSACGGGFGSKLDISFQPYIALACYYLKTPCFIVYSRTESMQSTTKRHPAEISLQMGCDKAGKIQYFDFFGVFNTGAYASWGPTVANRVPIHASGPYFIPNYSARSEAVHTHTAPSGAFRGFGVPQSAVAQERCFDMLAERAGIDPLEFRIINALDNNMPTATGQSFTSGVGIKQCLNALKPHYKRAVKEANEHNKTNTRIKRGVGLGSCWYGCGNTSMVNPSTIKMGVRPNGQLVLHQGAMDIGQGSNTVITQIAARAMQVDIGQIALVGPRTDVTPDAGKTSASRQTFVTGNAARLTAMALRQKILQMVNADGERSILQFADGQITITDGKQTHIIKTSQLPVDDEGYVLKAIETYDPPTKPLDKNGQGEPYAQYGYGVHLMELSVDLHYGTIQLIKCTAAHDVGQAINPLLVEGQVAGGIMQGVGLALMEEFIPGKTENLHDYLIPTIGDIPQIETIIIEEPDQHGPFGAKGLGEHVLIPTAPAILNAIANACGVAIHHLPANPSQIIRAYHEQRTSA